MPALLENQSPAKTRKPRAKRAEQVSTKLRRKDKPLLPPTQVVANEVWCRVEERHRDALRRSFPNLAPVIREFQRCRLAAESHSEAMREFFKGLGVPEGCRAPYIAVVSAYVGYSRAVADGRAPAPNEEAAA